jgi:hypothetical protein
MRIDRENALKIVYLIIKNCRSFVRLSSNLPANAAEDNLMSFMNSRRLMSIISGDIVTFGALSHTANRDYMRNSCGGRQLYLLERLA